MIVLTIGGQTQHFCCTHMHTHATLHTQVPADQNKRLGAEKRPHPLEEIQSFVVACVILAIRQRVQHKVPVRKLGVRVRCGAGGKQPLIASPKNLAQHVTRLLVVPVTRSGGKGRRWVVCTQRLLGACTYKGQERGCEHTTVCREHIHK